MMVATRRRSVKADQAANIPDRTSPIRTRRRGKENADNGMKKETEVDVIEELLAGSGVKGEAEEPINLDSSWDGSSDGRQSSVAARSIRGSEMGDADMGPDRKRARMSSGASAASSATSTLKTDSCQFCQKTFVGSPTKNATQLRLLHERRSHLKDYLSVTPLPHRCDTCGKAFETSAGMQTHQHYWHPDVRPVNAGRSSGQQSPNPKRMSWSARKCRFCDKMFYAQGKEKVNEIRTAHEEAEHLGKRTIANVNPYQCAICGAGFLRSSQLNEHQFDQHKEHVKLLGVDGTRHECGICSQSFTERKNRNRHWLTLHKMTEPHYDIAKSLDGRGETCDDIFEDYKISRWTTPKVRSTDTYQQPKPTTIPRIQPIISRANIERTSSSGTSEYGVFVRRR